MASSALLGVVRKWSYRGHRSLPGGTVLIDSKNNKATSLVEFGTSACSQNRVFDNHPEQSVYISSM